MHHRGFKSLAFILIVAVIVFVSGEIWYYETHWLAMIQTSTTVSSTPTIATSTGLSPGWAICNSPAFGYSLRNPSDWSISVAGRNTAGGATGTIVPVICGVTRPADTLDPINFGNGSMTINDNISESPDASIEYLLAVDPYYMGRDVLVSTTTLHDYELGTFGDGRIIILSPGNGGYLISFGGYVSTSTRNNILNSFRFIQAGK